MEIPSPYAMVRAALLVGGALVLARIAGHGLGAMMADYPDRQIVVLARKLASGAVFGLGVVMAVQQLGFDIGVLLGAAGILSVAVGFASQTSASNLISGLFLLGERPFTLGDVITVGDTTGEVLSIDALSVKLRTFDNIFVRIPNESLIKERVRTLSRFPIRRVDVKLIVGFREDLVALEAHLRAAGDATPGVLMDPRPLFMILGFEEYGLGIQFSVWATRETFLDVKNAVMRSIRDGLVAADVEIPYRHLDVRMDSVEGDT